MSSGASEYDPDAEDADPLSRAALEYDLECADDPGKLVVEQALLALVALEEHELYERSNGFGFLLNLFQLALGEMKITNDYLAGMNMVAERTDELVSFVFEKIEEYLPKSLAALDDMGDDTDPFIKNYMAYIKAMVTELVTGRVIE